MPGPDSTTHDDSSPPARREALRAAARARTRAWAAVASFALGSLAAARWAGPVPPVGLFALAAFACAAALVLRRHACNAALLLAVAALGAGWTAARIHAAPPDRLDLLLAPDTQADAAPDIDITLLHVRGVVLDAPAPAHTESAAPWQQDAAPAYRVRLALRALLADDGSATPASGTLTLRAPASAPFAFRAGDTVELLGRYIPPPRALNPGEPDRAALARQRSSVGSLALEDASEIARVARSPGARGLADAALAPLRALRAAVHARALAALDLDEPAAATAAPDRTRALRAALLLGLREPGSDELSESFRVLGVAHLLAISGFHLAALAGIVLLCLRLAGEFGRLEAPAVLAVVLAYALLLPAEAPIVRSAALFAAVALGESLGRRHDRLTLLAWVTLCLLVWRPLDAASLGLQLSVGITALLLWMHDRRTAALFTPPPASSPARAGLARLARAAWVALACWLVALPVIAQQTGALSLVGWLATLLLSPLIVAALALGFLAALAGVVWPAAAALPLWPANLALDAAVAAVTWADSLPLVRLSVPRPGWLAALALTALLVPVAVRARRATHALALAAALAGVAIALRAADTRRADAVLLRLDTLAVGDGTCHILRSGPDAMLWDAGSLSRADLGRRLLPAALTALDLRAIPSAAVSHPNIDHYNALPDAAARLGLRRVLVTPAFLDAADHQPQPAAALAALRAAGVRIDTMAAGTTLTLGAARIDILWPPASPHERAGLADNDVSTVALLRVQTDAGERRLLLFGDLQPEGIAALARRAPGLHAHAIELPHHGSARPASIAFVESLDPAVVVQSTGRSRLDDPRWEPARAGRVWATTASDGRVAVEFRRDGSIRVFTGPREP